MESFASLYVPGPQGGVVPAQSADARVLAATLQFETRAPRPSAGRSPLEAIAQIAAIVRSKRRKIAV